MNKLTATPRAQGVLILFGFIITISLFLGDGKQPLIDAVWACEIVLLYTIYYLQNKKVSSLPRALHIAWATLLGCFVVRALFSDSVGYSVSVVVRLFSAYLIYRLFYSIADKNHTPRVVLGIIIIGAVATIVSFGCLLFPQFVSQLPQMNLLYASYGHNQLADLLLFCVPIIIAKTVPVPIWCKRILLVIFLTGLVFSFARGAWILSAAYFAFLLVTKRLDGKFTKFVAIVFVGAVAGLLFTMFLLAPRLVHDSPIANNNWLYRQTIKPFAYESRVQYWLQALHAIQERPIFGSGPGTFYLQSIRLQNSPVSYSWFAHSFVLEQFGEVGLVGLILWVILFVLQWRLLTPLRASPIFIGVILTFLYSMYEYNLNYLIIWLLFWAALGWLTGSVQIKKEEARGLPLFILTCMTVLFLFSVFSLGGAIGIMNNNIDAGSLFAPFVADIAKASIENHTENVTPIQKKQLSLLLFFHKKNPEILYAVAKYYGAMDKPDDAAQWYNAAIRQDPKNFIYQQEYLQFVIEKGRFLQAGLAIKQCSVNMLPDRLRGQIESISFVSPVFVTALSSVDITKFESNPPDLYYAKLYYVLGENTLSKNAWLTKQLWTIARDIYPDMGLLHHELASLELYIFHYLLGAQKIVAACMQIPHAALHCRQILPNLENVPLPGHVDKDIILYR